MVGAFGSAGDAIPARYGRTRSTCQCATRHRVTHVGKVTVSAGQSMILVADQGVRVYYLKCGFGDRQEGRRADVLLPRHLRAGRRRAEGGVAAVSRHGRGDRAGDGRRRLRPRRSASPDLWRRRGGVGHATAARLRAPGRRSRRSPARVDHSGDSSRARRPAPGDRARHALGRLVARLRRQGIHPGRPSESPSGAATPHARTDRPDRDRRCRRGALLAGDGRRRARRRRPAVRHLHHRRSLPLRTRRPRPGGDQGRRDPAGVARVPEGRGAAVRRTRRGTPLAVSRHAGLHRGPGRATGPRAAFRRRAPALGPSGTAGETAVRAQTRRPGTLRRADRPRHQGRRRRRATARDPDPFGDPAQRAGTRVRRGTGHRHPRTRRPRRRAGLGHVPGRPRPGERRNRPDHPRPPRRTGALTGTDRDEAGGDPADLEGRRRRGVAVARRVLRQAGAGHRSRLAGVRGRHGVPGPHPPRLDVPLADRPRRRRSGAAVGVDAASDRGAHPGHGARVHGHPPHAARGRPRGDEPVGPRTDGQPRGDRGDGAPVSVHRRPTADAAPADRAEFGTAGALRPLRAQLSRWI
ncbi:hypothetical protein AORI_1816 [Amycolatopsis keratiniphila]|uniref:Uncharacterized protein n=1 Tax=Amycolatopsis keratiniphila TaxID=129921 RepID=R4SLJ1_9PSEU|nr:hypothetical protein AORI_1816 [Amycolatopsis keratiniphila]